MPWSAPLELTCANCRKVPPAPGVYKIIQGRPYSCYRGETEILKFGMSKKGLCEELMNHLVRHTCANRVKRILGQDNISVSFCFEALQKDKVAHVEAKLLRNFERKHWQLPILNSTRGFARGKDRDWNEEA